MNDITIKINDRVGGAADCINEMKDTKSFVMVPMPLLQLLQDKNISLQAFALYVGFIYPRANLQKNYFAKFRMKDLIAFTRKTSSTIRNYLVELERAGLIAREYWTFDQKTLLVGCELTFLDSDSETMIRETKNRSDAGQDKRSSLWPSQNNKRSPQPSNSRPITTEDKQINNNNKQSVPLINCSPDKIFEPFEIARIKKTLTKAGVSDPRTVLNEIAFSVTNGTWNLPKSGKINAILKLIKKGSWRTPSGMF